MLLSIKESVDAVPAIPVNIRKYLNEEYKSHKTNKDLNKISDLHKNACDFAYDSNSLSEAVNNLIPVGAYGFIYETVESSKGVTVQRYYEGMNLQS